MSSFNLGAAGAGAAEGLDTFLARLLAQEQVDQRGTAQAETSRHNVAEEALSGRNLDQNDTLRQSLESERASTIAERGRLGEAERTRQAAEQALLDNPDTPPAIKQFLGLRRVVPKGETIPIEVLGLKKAGAEKSLQGITIDLPGVGESLPATRNPDTGAILYQGKDVTSTPDGKPLARVHQQPAMQIVPTDTGFQRVSRTGPQGMVTTGPNNTPVMPQSPAQVRTRVATSQKVEQIIPDLESEGDAVNAMGLMGPIGGRWADFAAGTWGSAADLKAVGYNLTPEQEQTLNEFRTDLGFLKSGTAMVHGGARGGGSAQIMARMDQLINATKMDYNGFKGSLKSFKKLLAKYSSFGEDGPVDEKGGGGDDLFQQYLNRQKP